MLEEIMVCNTVYCCTGTWFQPVSRFAGCSLVTTVSQLLVWEPKHRRLWILCLIGGVNRYVGQLSVNISVVCQSWTGGADTRPIYHRYVTDTRPTVHRYIADTLPIPSQLTADDDRLMIGRYSDRLLDRYSMINQNSTDTRPTFSRHVDLYRPIRRPTLDRYSADTRVDISIDIPYKTPDAQGRAQQQHLLTN